MAYHTWRPWWWWRSRRHCCTMFHEIQSSAQTGDNSKTNVKYWGNPVDQRTGFFLRRSLFQKLIVFQNACYFCFVLNQIYINICKYLIREELRFFLSQRELDIIPYFWIHHAWVCLVSDGNWDPTNQEEIASQVSWQVNAWNYILSGLSISICACYKFKL